MPKKKNKPTSVDTEKLTKLEALWSMVNESLTRKEFDTSIGNLVTIIEKLDGGNKMLIGKQTDALNNALTRLKTEGDSYLASSLSSILTELKTKMLEIQAEHEVKMYQVDEKLLNVRDGKDGEPGKPADEALIISKVLAELPPVELPTPDTPDEMIEKINKSGLIILKERVEGLADAIRMATMNAVASSVAVTTSFFNGLRAKNLTIVGTGTATVTANQVGDLVTVTVNTTGSALAGTQEKSTTTPDGNQTTFAFTHTPGIIVWNGAIQTLTDDYTVSSLNITFTGSAGIPQTNDKIINIYA